MNLSYCLVKYFYIFTLKLILKSNNYEKNYKHWFCKKPSEKLKSLAGLADALRHGLNGLYGACSDHTAG